jgi:hypothetical protein
MLKNIVITYMASPCRTLSRCHVLLLWSVMALSVTSCTPITINMADPVTPELISVQGHGTFHATFYGENNVFKFAAPVEDTASQTVIHYTQSTVRFKVPYPTSIELAINGKPLTKVDPPQSNNYEYSGIIDNPGANPATWSVGIKTPFDVPLFGTTSYPTYYKLTIVNVSGSKRSQPLTITYRQPDLYIPSPPMTMTGGTTTHRTDTPSTPPGHPGPCAGGANEQTFPICAAHPATAQKRSLGIPGCTYADALKSIQSGLSPADGWSFTSGTCPP